MLLPHGISKRIGKKFSGLGSSLLRIFPSVEYDIEKTDIDMSAAEYLAASVINSLFVFIFLSVVMFPLAYLIRKETLINSLLMSIGSGFGLSVVIFVLLSRYPLIIANKKAESLERNLVFALKDLLLQISSGVSIYNAFVNVSKADYGLVSVEFAKMIQEVNAGKPMDDVLERLAIRSSSEYLRKTVWQLVNTLRAGASLKAALKTIITQLTLDQKTKIRDYAKELNVWSLMYMLFAVAIPTIGITMIVILSAFAGMGINKAVFIFFILACLVIQYVLIGLVKTRRPMGYV